MPEPAAECGQRLRWLQPKTYPEQGQHVETSSEDDGPSTSDFLESISRSFIEAINKRQLSRNSLPWTYMDRKIFRATFDQANLTELDLDEYLAALKWITSTHPKHRVEVQQIMVAVDKDETRADVFLTVKTLGLPDDGLVTEGIGFLKWMKTDGEWWCVRYKGSHARTQAEPQAVVNDLLKVVIPDDSEAMSDDDISPLRVAARLCEEALEDRTNTFPSDACGQSSGRISKDLRPMLHPYDDESYPATAAILSQDNARLIFDPSGSIQRFRQTNRTVKSLEDEDKEKDLFTWDDYCTKGAPWTFADFVSA
ncbi:hypothetical protein PRZ48_006605 [Zasmidium cellare]|uniref:SnoaL-like domain-containing protein n=1 Tax=Zasmidium cellare TaxID=395010 RepID=A0ABR0ENJ3_ZASCE|nr:hypothetical protein PRZ48_006605 [Zasmidium cellare]